MTKNMTSKNNSTYNKYFRTFGNNGSRSDIITWIRLARDGMSLIPLLILLSGRVEILTLPARTPLG